MEIAKKVTASFVYLVLGQCSFERLTVIKAIASKLKADRLETFKVSEGQFGAAIAQLNTRPLFADYSLVLLEDVEKLTSQDLEAVSKIIDNPPDFSYLILAGSNIDKKETELYRKLKSKGVVTDFNEEKPWDKEKRITAKIIELTRSFNKELTPDALKLLVKMIGWNTPFLENELKKVVSFVGEKSKIDALDIQAICCNVVELDGWKIAEEIVWKGRKQIEKSFFSDVSDSIALVGQLRYHYQIALQIRSMLDSELSKTEIVSFFHRMRPAKVEEYIELIRNVDLKFFKKGLQCLYELERSLKGSFMDAELIFNIFLAKIC